MAKDETKDSADGDATFRANCLRDKRVKLLLLI